MYVRLLLKLSVHGDTGKWPADVLKGGEFAASDDSAEEREDEEEEEEVQEQAGPSKKRRIDKRATWKEMLNRTLAYISSPQFDEADSDLESEAAEQFRGTIEVRSIF